MSRQELEDRWFELGCDILPRMAKENNWLIRFDHCFFRVGFDNACGCKWNTVVKSPGYKNMSDRDFQYAVYTLELIRLFGRNYLDRVNRQSLQYRGKLR